jgi:hypothetical protein
MTSPELQRLAAIGQLRRVVPSAAELERLVQSGEARLADASNPALSLESRFDLGYNAAHALALAALRKAGFRSDNRYVVFQALPHTLGLPAATWRVLAKCHGLRNQAEYEGVLDLDERLVDDLIAAASAVREARRAADA